MFFDSANDFGLPLNDFGSLPLISVVPDTDSFPADTFTADLASRRSVAIGRPVLYGLSLGGWMGVKSVYERLQAELTRDMTIAGIGSVKEFQRDYVMAAPGTVPNPAMTKRS